MKILCNLKSFTTFKLWGDEVSSYIIKTNEVYNLEEKQDTMLLN